MENNTPHAKATDRKHINSDAVGLLKENRTHSHETGKNLLVTFLIVGLIFAVLWLYGYFITQQAEPGDKAGNPHKVAGKAAKTHPFYINPETLPDGKSLCVTATAHKLLLGHTRYIMQKAGYTQDEIDKNTPTFKKLSQTAPFETDMTPDKSITGVFCSALLEMPSKQPVFPVKYAIYNHPQKFSARVYGIEKAYFTHDSK